MRTLRNVLIYVGLGLAMIFGVVFSFIELRTFFAGDFALFNNPIEGGFAYLFRSIYFLSVIGIAITLLVFKLRNRKFNTFLLVIAAALFVGALFTFIFYDYYISLIIVFANLITLFLAAFGFFKKEKVIEAKEEEEE